MFSKRYRLFNFIPRDPGIKEDANHVPVHGDLLAFDEDVGKFVSATPPIIPGIGALGYEGALLVWDNTNNYFTASATPWLDPAIGDISCQDVAVAQAVTATPAKLLAFDANGLAMLVTPDHTDDSLEVEVDGFYEVHFNVTYAYAAAGVVQFHIRVDAAESIYGFKQETLNVGDIMNGSCVGRLNLGAEDVVTVYVEADAEVNLTVSDAQLTIQRISQLFVV